ncbi:hypothetical protein V2G26_000286 [Clonostachys chloroleuca]
MDAGSCHITQLLALCMHILLAKASYFVNQLSSIYQLPSREAPIAERGHYFQAIISNKHGETRKANAKSARRA